MPAVNISDLTIESLTKMIGQVAAASSDDAAQDPALIAAIEAVARQVGREGGGNEQIAAALEAVAQAIVRKP